MLQMIRRGLTILFSYVTYKIWNFICNHKRSILIFLSYATAATLGYYCSRYDYTHGTFLTFNSQNFLKSLAGLPAKAGGAISSGVVSPSILVFSPASGRGIVFDGKGQPIDLLDTKNVDKPKPAKNINCSLWLKKSSELRTVPAGNYPYRRAYDTMLLEEFKSYMLPK